MTPAARHAAALAAAKAGGSPTTKAMSPDQVGELGKRLLATIEDDDFREGRLISMELLIGGALNLALIAKSLTQT